MNRKYAPEKRARMLYPFSLEDMFARSVRTESGCIELQGSTNQKGYTRVFVAGRPTPGHRAAYILANGAIPEGKLIMHKCDNRVCINPEHLCLGTDLENMRDCINKGRFNARSYPKHNPADVVRMYLANIPIKDIAAALGISKTTLYTSLGDTPRREPHHRS